MDDPIAPAYPVRARRRGWTAILAVALVAFALGLAAMLLVMRSYGAWFGTAAAPAAAPTPQTATGPAFSPAAPLTASGTPSVDFDGLQSREQALTGRIAGLETQLAQTATAADAAAGNANRAEGLLIAFAARRALDRGLGLGYLEGQLRSRFGGVQPEAVATVIAGARQPVTLEDLRAGMEAIGPQLRTGNTTDGWWASLRRELSDLIVVRRETAPSPRAEDRLSRARRMLEGGQVEAALAEVARLPGAEAGDRWIAAARRYIDARRALDVIEGAAIQGRGRDPVVPTQPGSPAAGTQPSPVPSDTPRPATDPVTGAPIS